MKKNGKIIECKICKKSVYKPRCFVKSKFCSYNCYWKSLKGKKLSKKVYKENSKRLKGKPQFFHRGEKHPFWKGGRHGSGDGYIRVYRPDHLNAVARYVLEHRLVMERHIGRYLKKSEVVHHINKRKSDNRLSNLMLFPNHAAHKRFHKTKCAL